LARQQCRKRNRGFRLFGQLLLALHHSVRQRREPGGEHVLAGWKPSGLHGRRKSTGANSNTDSHAHANTDSHTYPNTDSHTDANTDAHTYSDTTAANTRAAVRHSRLNRSGELGTLCGQKEIL
jgi:hypothetical protein